MNKREVTILSIIGVALVALFSITLLGTNVLASYNATNVWCPPSGLWGDVTSNNEITTFDITILRLYLNGNRTLIGNYTQCLDASGDGNITNFDINVTRWYILGENTTGYPVGTNYTN